MDYNVDAWGAIDRRREAARPQWGTPSTGDYLLDAERGNAFADASARTRGARWAAASRAPNDPSLAAYADLSSLLGSQGDTARSLNRVAAERMQVLDARAWQEYLLRLKREWEQRDAERQARAGLWGDVLNTGGRIAMAAL